MKIERIWAMPNTATFRIRPVVALLNEYCRGKWLDPFCGGARRATITNDLNPERSADFHDDAVDFLKRFVDASVDGVLLDPPYSLHQVTRSYAGYGDKRVNALTPVYDQCARVVRPGGLVIHFGWNTNGAGAKRCFVIEHILLVPHGGHHNDTIVTVERRLVTP